jgi:hypothetical protein
LLTQTIRFLFVCVHSPVFVFLVSLPAMPFSALASIELQLIMQCCDSISLLRLARCCRNTMAAADAPFAWLHASSLPLTIASVAQLSDPHFTIPSGRLLRHVGLSVRWPHRAVARGWQGPVSEEEMTGMARLLPHVRALDASARQLRGEDVCALLNHEGVAQWSGLRILLLNKSHMFLLDEQCLRLIAARLPRLHTLGVSLSFDCTARALEPFATSDHLTDLRLVAKGGEVVKGLVSASSLKRLRRLSLVDHTFDSWLSTLSGSVSLRSSLRHLGLDNPGPNYVHRGIAEEDEDTQAACRRDHEALFANLPMLESLLLRQCRNVHAMMDALLVHCLQLRLLRLEPFSLTSRHVANRAHLDQLLSLRPACVLELRVRTLTAYKRQQGHSSAAPKEWAHAQQEWAPLRNHARVRYVEDDACSLGWDEM